MKFCRQYLQSTAGALLLCLGFSGSIPASAQDCDQNDPCPRPSQPCQTRFTTVCFDTLQKPGCFKGQPATVQQIYAEGLKALLATDEASCGTASLLMQLSSQMNLEDKASALSYAAIYGHCSEAEQARNVLAGLMGGFYASPLFLGCQSTGCETSLESRLNVAKTLMEVIIANSQDWNNFRAVRGRFIGFAVPAFAFYDAEVVAEEAYLASNYTNCLNCVENMRGAELDFIRKALKCGRSALRAVLMGSTLYDTPEGLYQAIYTQVSPGSLLTDLTTDDTTLATEEGDVTPLLQVTVLDFKRKAAFGARRFLQKSFNTYEALNTLVSSLQYDRNPSVAQFFACALSNLSNTEEACILKEALAHYYPGLHHH